MRRLVVCTVVNEKGEILLLHRTKDRKYAPDKWYVVSGHIAGEELPAVTLKRELMEELGIMDFRLLRKAIPYVENSTGESVEVHAFLVSTHQLLRVDTREHDQWKWILPDKIKHHDIPPYLVNNLAIVGIQI